MFRYGSQSIILDSYPFSYIYTSILVDKSNPIDTEEIRRTWKKNIKTIMFFSQYYIGYV